MNCIAYKLYWNILSRNVNPIATQQAAIDNALVPSEKRLKIERCNARIAFNKLQKEETYQVTLDALKLSPCYLAFQITAEVPEIYMHQFWNTIKKIRKTDGYKFKLDKIKCRVDTKVFCTLNFVSKTEDYQIYGAVIPDGMINDDIKLSKAYKTYLDYATGKVPPKKTRKFKKPASPKLKTVPASPKEPTQKEAQMKKTLKKSKRQTHNLQASGSSEGADFELEVPNKPIGKTKDTSERTGVKPGVPDVSKDDSSDSNNDSWGDRKNESDDDHDKDDNDDDEGNDDDSGNDDDGHNDAQDSDQNDSDDEENPFFTLKDYEEEEQDEEYVFSLEKDKSDDEKRCLKKKTTMSQRSCIEI
nr:hypothetical protein [Tanacetum cinerariifolium]